MSTIIYKIKIVKKIANGFRIILIETLSDYVKMHRDIMEDTNPLKWKTIDSKKIYSSPWCSLREDKVKLPNGTIINDYSVVELPDVAMVFAINQDKTVPFVKQYRYGVNKVLLELPAGTYKKGEEDPEKAAKRELWEETGYKAKKLVRLGVIHDYPTKDTHSITIYFTDDTTYEKHEYKEPSENIEIINLPLDEIDNYINNGEIAVAGSIAGIYLAKQYLNK